MPRLSTSAIVAAMSLLAAGCANTPGGSPAPSENQSAARGNHDDAPTGSILQGTDTGASHSDSSVMGSPALGGWRGSR